MATGYGFFIGGDPRDFTPDPECSTEAERERHRLACDAWDRGEQVSEPDCVERDGVRLTRCQFGLGTYEYPDEWDEEDEAAWRAQPCTNAPDCPCGACDDARRRYEDECLRRFRGEGVTS